MSEMMRVWHSMGCFSSIGVYTSIFEAGDTETAQACGWAVSAFCLIRCALKQRRRFATQIVLEGLFDSVLESLSCAELRNLHSRDLDGLASARIAGLTGGALFDRENTETGDGDLFAFLERVNDAVNG